jgi:hypothetical protein
MTDVMEWVQGGFSEAQLWLNYVAFLPLPAVMVGLYAVQRPFISRVGLAGAVLYGFAFIYFAHTTLAALASRAATYAELWSKLGTMYSVHGLLMIAGGGLFGWDVHRAKVFPRWTATFLLLGIAVNLIVALLPVPELLQTIGTALRNVGLMGMGWNALRSPARLPGVVDDIAAPATERM